MNYLTELAAVYDRIIDTEGIAVEKPLPLYHIQNNCQVTIVLDERGNFKRAEANDPKNRSERATCMPCTEKSSARSSGITAYPLCEKFDYAAGDINDFIEKPDPADSKTIREYEDLINKNQTKHDAYIKELESWALSSYSHKKIKAVYEYIKRKTLVKDLVTAGFFSKDSGKAIFDQMTDFIRWSVEIPGEQSELWKDKELQSLWVKYYEASSNQPAGFCYVLGKENALISLHPAKIRNSGDKAKIISSNDSSNFTFRGRFAVSEEACQVSAEVSLKAHNALRYLIARQGTRVGEGLHYVCWNKADRELPKITASGLDLIAGDEEVIQTYTTAQAFAQSINKKIHGYFSSDGGTAHENIMIIGLNAATPGRLSVVLYRELLQTDFCIALENWHTRTAWFYSYFHKEEKKWVRTISSPAPVQIAEAAYGEHVKSSQIEKTVERLIPCILDGKLIPVDLEKQCSTSASNLMVVEKYKREMVLGIACAVFKYNQVVRKKEVFTVALEKERTSRDYLFGRLLAVADELEKAALQERGEDRETNAMRYMQRFSRYPSSTWKMLYEKLLPYKKHTRYAARYENYIKDITNLFDHDSYISDKPLTGEYLLGYQCQKKDFYTKQDSEVTIMEEK